MKRESNFEMLRVPAMFFIVSWRFIVHGIMHVLTSEIFNLLNEFTSIYY